jgi:hypothetical protein
VQSVPSVTHLLASSLWQNFALSVCDAQYEQHMVHEDGTLTLLGRLNDQLNVVPSNYSIH